MDTKVFSERIANIIFTKKGYDVKILDLQELTTIADYFVVCSADSDVQVKAIADEVDKVLRKNGIKCYHKEGYDALQWILLDYFDVVVHIFHKEAREFYSLEKLWGDAPVIEMKDPAEDKVE
ncbi:MAG: ribosome silencing factor [Rhodothermaceae bacterium]